MNKNQLQLNKTTKSLKVLFPALSALMAFTPLMVCAETTITRSTDTTQVFSSDNEYIINKGVSIHPSTSDPSVTLSGSTINKVTNNGEITGQGDALYIATGGQTLEVNNEEDAIINSTSGNGITVIDMGGTIKNAGNITGAENGIKIKEDSSSFNIANTNTGLITGKTALSTDAGFTLDNDGTFNGLAGNGVELLKSGKSKIENNGTIQGTLNGVIASDDNRLQLINSGLIKGTESAITFNSTQNNSLTLKEHSQLDGDVFSGNSKGNTLTLLERGSEDSNFLGLNDEDGFASLTMDGTEWSLTGNVDVIGSGDSILVNTGKLTLAGTVKNDSGNTLIADSAMLQLGDGTNTGSLTGNVTNNGTFFFNQGSDSIFASDMSGSGKVEKIDAHLLTLTGNNSYTGNTLLKSGTTLVAEGATLGSAGNTATVTVDNGATFASAGTVNNNVDILSGGVLASWNAVAGNNPTSSETVNTINGNVTNSGTLQISGLNDYVGNNFTINGDYTGASGSQIVMNSILGDDSSATDHLSITGNSAGQSGVKLSNIGGLGAQTVNGIEVINVGGNSDASFSLAKPAVVGAWEYNLNQKSDGNWYLESKTPPTPTPPDDDQGDNTDNGGSDDNTDNGGSDDNADNGGNNEPEVMAPEVGAYLGNYLAAQGMFLHKRDDRDQLTLRDTDDLNTWMYVKGRYHDNDIAGGKVSYDTTEYVMQVGSDFISKQLDTGVLHSGMMFGAGQAKTDSTARYNDRSAQGKVDGVNVGLYATWQEDEQLRKGSYIDSWASFGWYHNKLRSDDRSNESYNSQGFAVSLEAGHAWIVGSENERTWKIEPQIQAVYSYLDQENHTDVDGVRVSTLDNDSVLGRVGVKTSYFNQKDVQAWQPYVAVNWLKGAGQNDIALNGEKFTNDTPDDRGQLELGISGKLNPTTMISLRANGEWGENSYDAYGGHILLNHRW
ncbi:autotransporter outer membrane beta-barrel domain-containing protein [Enterobacteriaceae bacterium H4N4]|uniref:Autotransporter outer membrane beta-barrel domain-containing protein n=1 Tax=Silvania confinis TaxID=2926470 RepID=A0A9J6QBK8_9ENTR|nr:autotransporter outer membrane beta-barrel domain-containing protein [Silvania confinis]MCU6668068.1 autotransporter outer membrane beta-barrel domain-containing protein [Silvania confinis]